MTDTRHLNIIHNIPKCAQALVKITRVTYNHDIVSGSMQQHHRHMAETLLVSQGTLTRIDSRNLSWRAAESHPHRVSEVRVVIVELGEIGDSHNVHCTRYYSIVEHGVLKSSTSTHA
jgi:hypothetical protein